jgi:hypothetical protein
MRRPAGVCATPAASGDCSPLRLVLSSLILELQIIHQDYAVRVAPHRRVPLPRGAEHGAE